MLSPLSNESPPDLPALVLPLEIVTDPLARPDDSPNVPTTVDDPPISDNSPLDDPIPLKPEDNSRDPPFLSLDPPVNNKSPPPTVSTLPRLSPTDRIIAPDAPPTAFPVFNINAPLEPDIDDPDETLTDPDADLPESETELPRDTTAAPSDPPSINTFAELTLNKLPEFRPSIAYASPDSNRPSPLDLPDPAPIITDPAFSEP